MPNWSGGARLPHRYWPSKGRQRHGGGGSLKAILRGISTYKNPGSMGWPVGIRNHVLLRYLLFFFGAFRLVYTEKPERTMLGLEWRCRAPAPLLVPTPVPPPQGTPGCARNPEHVCNNHVSLRHFIVLSLGLWARRYIR